MLAWETILLRLVLASILGAVIGLERERKNWSAGMRTHMMVSLGSALTILVSSYGFADVIGDHIALDPSRIAAQVISGIGFLGAGIIMFLKPGFIRGLTTASGLWTVAAIGLATGAGMYIAAVAATIIALIILLILQPIEKRFARRFKHHIIRISLSKDADPYTVIDRIMLLAEHQIDTLSFNRSAEGFLIEINFNDFDIKEIAPTLSEIEKDENVKEVYWTR